MRKVQYFWMLLGRCNYRCPYCVYGQAESDRRRQEPRYGAGEWLAAWRRMRGLYGEGDIVMTGGEPTLFPGFSGFVLELSSMFHVAFDTNLSWDKESLAGLLARADPARLRFETSFHPLAAETEPFLEKVRMIAGKGFGYINRLVAYPPLLDRVPELRELFAREGLTFVVNPFQGTYAGRRYPQDYTEAEKALIRGAGVNVWETADNAPHGEFVRQVLDRESPQGRLCRAGSEHVRIEDDARVFRCGEYSTRGWEALGHFMDEGLRLWDESRPCRSDRCEWEYRWLVDQKERFKNG
jgi:MoaA/NifB/PqqE/SkfB family radical SAM enzyme